MNGAVFCFVAAIVVIPYVIYEPETYLAVVLRFWRWIAFAAFGWMAASIYLLRRIQELRLKAPGARTQAQERS